MSKVKEDLHKFIDSMPEDKVIYALNMLISIQDLFFDEEEPDEFDLKLIKENTAIISALKHAVEEIDAKVTNIDFTTVNIQGEITGLKKDFGFVETATIKNLYDIDTLKKVEKTN